MMAGLGPVRRLVANTTEEINIAYRPSDIVRSDGRWPRRAVRPGRHAPEVGGLTIAGERRTLWEAFDRTEHTVLHLPSSADGPEPMTAGIAAGLQQQYGPICRQLIVLPAAVPPNDAVTQVIDPGGRVAERFGTTGRSATFVVRPDGYIGYRTTRPTVQGIGGYFDRIAGRAG
jgi:pentachlorophenol monooxygenase